MFIGQLTGILATIEDISERRRIERELSEKTATLAVVTEALSSFLESGDWAGASKRLLAHALKQTQSPSGLLGVVLDGPNLRILAHEGMGWEERENRQLYEEKISQQTTQGFFEVSYQRTLFGEIIHKGKAFVWKEPSRDARWGGVPAGHPKMHDLLGVPILKGTTVVGLVVVANRAGGYTGEESRLLETISQATGVLYDNYPRM